MTTICPHSVLSHECDLGDDVARLTRELADTRAEHDGLRAVLDSCHESLGEPIPAYLPDAIKEMQSALAAARKDGWVLVPRKPTPEMCAAAMCVSEAEYDPAQVYRAMLAAIDSARGASAEYNRRET